LTALALAGRGYPILPLHPPLPDGSCACGRSPGDDHSVGKHPHDRLVPNGFHDASTNSTQIERWLHQRPTPNLGVVPSGDAFIVDVDGDGLDRWLTLWDELGGLEPTFIVATANGFHVWARWPAGEPQPTGSFLGFVTRWPGKGYVVAPYSRHPSGALYRPIDNRRFQLVTLPAPWLEAARAHQRQRTSGEEIRLEVGERHEFYVSIAGYLRSRGIGMEAIADALAAIDRDHASVPHGEAYARGLAADIASRYQPDPEVHLELDGPRRSAVQPAAQRSRLRPSAGVANLRGVLS